MVLHFHRPCYRHESRGFAEGKQRVLCVYFADRGYKSHAGDVSHTIAAHDKKPSHGNLAKFITNVPRGVTPDESVAQARITISEESSAHAVNHWEFCTLGCYDHIDQEVLECNILISSHENDT